MSTGAADVPHSRANAVRFFEEYTNKHASALSGKQVIDLSTGSGYIIHLFEKVGARVSAYDLFPEQNRYATVSTQFMDLTKRWTMADHQVDYLILAETIEHLPDQHFFFAEAARVLKTGGKLLLTTPNASSLRSRLSQFIGESEHYSTPAPNELNAFTRWNQTDAGNGYFSKLFISGILRLRTLGSIQGLKLEKVHRSRSSTTSWILMLLYPVIQYVSWKHLRKQLKEDPTHHSTYREVYKWNTSVAILTDKHLLMEFIKAG